ncbi:MAG: hypothetical protein A2273_09920 [Candidatus Edwardsbacteria bacterium RifOxyA12_full_54_48]|uniref:Uncharacterized protein n=1 Tax=Candidatus Edwardsbacteria bacterium GWF2_54_11 TaxID=1817851 RepID=A0A1F5RE48_9BACT|nr:MAG: hypothetical protein A2502_00450 [Candidatus Edwardsbacteria bacterium RifOxyC12_full_54_24]OGF06092.1 MAG: hypothetical protein A2273_09920 [Candidatus Edwardsbacteria bacterium RifOxyA12_full_54_48]OGF12674.1 MAG: hypothetical protein A2024_00385 [Candidatus Edwardsbacteria bacterium GWF2_54_11]
MILQGGDINLKDQKGHTPLFRLIRLLEHWRGDRRQYIEILKSLISCGASVNCVGGSGWYSEDGRAIMEGYTPLWLLVVYPCRDELSDMKMEVAKILLGAGADINTRLYDNSSLLAYAVNQRDIEFAQLLIIYGADPNEVVKGRKLSEIIGSRNEEIRKAQKLTDEAFDLIQNGHYSTAGRVLREAAQYETVLVKEMFDRIQNDYDSKIEYAVRFMEYHRDNQHQGISFKTGFEWTVKSLLYHTFFK